MTWDAGSTGRVLDAESDEKKTPVPECIRMRAMVTLRHKQVFILYFQKKKKKKIKNTKFFIFVPKKKTIKKRQTTKVDLVLHTKKTLHCKSFPRQGLLPASGT
jgi:hypothetical protein